MITSTDLYAMGMESETAYQHMRELCELVGVAYPPIPEALDTSRRAALPDPLEMQELYESAPEWWKGVPA